MPRTWLRRWAAASLPNLLAYSSQDLAMSVAALGKLQWQPPQAWTHTLFAAAAASFVRQGGADQLNTVHSRLQKLRALAMVVHGLARMRVLPPPQLTDALLAAAAQTLPLVGGSVGTYGDACVLSLPVASAALIF
jgi:hypothetical protein